jgi:uncharacterized protein (DUF362 family)
VKPRAFLARVKPDGSDYLVAIREGLAYIGFGEGLPAPPRLFIKPNLTFPSYRPGVMTSPEALEAAIATLKDYTPHITIGDSDSGGYNPFRMEDVYEATGISEFAGRHGVQVVNLSRLERQTIPISTRRGRTFLAMPRLLTEEIDALITMPVPKIHMNTGVSLTFKNQWGCIPEPNDRLRLHPDFSEVVVEVNRAVKAAVAIIDGRFGLNVSGPLRGQPVALNWVCVTNSIGAGARIACELMQINLRRIAHLRFAESRGLVPALADIEINTGLQPFLGPRFYLKRRWTDIPGYLAFHNSALTYVAYFSRWAKPLHRLLYVFREPFYDYGQGGGRGSNGPTAAD